MSIANLAQAIAGQMEYVRPELPTLYNTSSRLMQRIKTRTDVEVTSSRPSRIPFWVLAGGKFRMANFDGGDLGIGSGPVQQNGYLSCVPFVYAYSYTLAADWTNDSSQKAVENYVTKTNADAVKGFAGYIESLLQGNGSGQIDTVVSVAGNQVVVNNANLFSDNQDVDVWTAVNGAYLGTITIQSVDKPNNSLWLPAAAPGYLVANVSLQVSGSLGVSNSSLLGLRYWHQAGNTGNFAGIQRSAYPGKFVTPYLNCSGGTLTPQFVRAMEAQIELLIGSENFEKLDLLFQGNVDMRAAWENVYLTVQRVIANDTGNTGVDMLKKAGPRMMAGREFMTNERAMPGMIDGIAASEWFRLELKSLDMLDIGGETLFPMYGGSGGIAASVLFYYVYWGQFALGNPQSGVFANNISIPQYYFGHS